ncbi:hypothetical protein FHY55_09380 [Oceanicola sp. D3]|uniref:hypothetical protein n=1 Tax=Oceanicola sp. D3 TaxID=2587163 RepID=UPI00111D6881|nr:hypothetical protein [Oceanicola sp. D3]QDC09444.1 hypothetical protein FHY55_09380 [Oceanicola sp. D3]
MTEPTEGQQEAARIATTRNALDLGALSLIAIIGKPNARRAILRHRSGRVETVALGTQAAGGTVTGIGSRSLTLKLDGKPLRLSLPG